MTRVVLLVLLISAFQIKALSIIFRKFGTPIAVADKVVFTSVDGFRLICISRQDGKIIWETRHGQEKIRAGFLHKDTLLVTSGSTLLSCDMKSGRLISLWNCGLERCGLQRLTEDLILITGDTGRVDHLVCFDVTQQRERWRRPFAVEAVCQADEILCVREAKRKYVTREGYQPIDVRLTAIDINTGSNRWTHALTSNPSSLEAVAVEGYFVVGEEALLRCIEQRSGRIGQSRDFRMDQGYVPLALCGYKRNAVVWTRESIHVVHSLSIPSLEKKLLFYADSYAATAQVIGDVLIGKTIGRTEAYNILTGKKLWSGGQWNWSNDADNYILYSEMASGGKTATVNEIELKTGVTRKLYEEPLPPPSK